jgi:acetylornithine deacetylase
MSDPVALLETLISHDSHNPGGDEPRLAELLERELRRRGADTVERVIVPRPDGDDRPGQGAYVWAAWGRPTLVVNAHLDTVPANAGWTGDPWTPRVAGGRVVGLGAADTKGAIAAILCALDQVRPDGVAVLFSGDEEMGGTCMRHAIDSGTARGVTQAIVCEPTSCRAGIRHRGVAALVVDLAGAGGHSSNADRMPAPLADLARVAVAFDDWGRARRGEGPPGFEGMCANVAKLDGGVAFNVVPDRASLSFSLRPPPGADQRRILDDLVGIASRTAPGSRTKVLLDNTPFATRDVASFGRWLGAIVDAPFDMGFWTEAAVLSNAGIDCVVFGPGDIARAHAPDEFVPIDDLARARDAFVSLFTESRRGAR